MSRIWCCKQGTSPQKYENQIVLLFPDEWWALWNLSVDPQLGALVESKLI